MCAKQHELRCLFAWRIRFESIARAAFGAYVSMTLTANVTVERGAHTVHGRAYIRIDNSLFGME